jgi:hypothetical protein
MKVILKPQFLIFLLILSGLLFTYSLWQREADIDDAWIGEHAYWLAKEGHVRSELMRGITQQEEYLIVHHKLLTLHGALFIRLFGFSVASLKSVSLLYFFIFLIAFQLYLRHKVPNNTQVLFAILLILCFPWAFKYAFVYRPEVMIMALTFVSWLLLEKIIQHHRRSIIPSFFAGILGGLSIAAHLNGLVVAAAGLIFLLSYRKFSQSLIFSMGVLLGSSVYFYDFNSTYGFCFWWYQMANSTALDSLPDTHPLLQPFINLAKEHQRFFHNPKIIASSILFIFSMIVGYKWLVKCYKPMLRYTLLLALLLALTAMHKSRQYILIYFPFLVIMVSEVYFAYFFNDQATTFREKWRKSKAVRLGLAILFMVFIVSGFYNNLKYSLNKFSAAENARVTEDFIKENPEDLYIVAPMTFIFNEIEKFGRIQSEVCYTEFQKSDPRIRGIGFLERTKSFNIRYIILSDYYRDLLGWEDPESVTLPQDFEIISKKNDKYLVIRRK